MRLSLLSGNGTRVETHSIVHSSGCASLEVQEVGVIRSRTLALVVILAAVYFVAGKLGLKLAFLHASATPVWPPTGIALAAFLLVGYRVWPGILVGAFLVNWATAGTAVTSISIAVGNTLEGLLGAYLINRFANGRRAFDRVQDIFKFAVLGGIVSTATSPTFGVTTLSLGGFADWASYRPIWWTWWLGDGVGALIVAPLLILWVTSPRPSWRRAQILEAILLLLFLVLVSHIVFGTLFHTKLESYPLEFLCIPFLTWAAFRFSQREAATAVAILSGVAIWSTLRGCGPFIRGTPNESLLVLQAFMGVMAVMTLVLAADVSARKRAEVEVRQLAVTDSLTGLANYRRLMDILDAEIKRSDRSGRPFAILLLDLDGLKQINDSHGHLVGSRALCRLAHVLRASCRSTDTPARYGGDEFALVLPEAGAEQTELVARRISEKLAGDLGHPSISASIGAAVCPQDGQTIEELFSIADRALYKAKGVRLQDRFAWLGLSNASLSASSS